MKTPVTFQGAKVRLAPAIADAIGEVEKLHDLCCGSGAVSLEFRSRGLRPDQIVMLDAGPWGLFWKAVGDGTFDLRKFRSICAEVPDEKRMIQGHMERMGARPVDVESAPYVFLLLQASSFGGKAIGIKNGRWTNCSFRAHWMPTPTSSRRYPVNPMMPMPDEIIKRLEPILDQMRGVIVHHRRIEGFCPEGGIVYIDPPYKGRTGYNRLDFDVVAYARSLSVPCFVSECRMLTADAICLSDHREKGGISGKRSKTQTEYLSVFN